MTERDFVGYGRHTPDPRWPDGARLALNFVLNYEEGAEPSMPDGDESSESLLTEARMRVHGRDLAAESMFEYGSRVGFWRILRAFEERGLPLTVFACARALERNPEAARAMTAAGFDICSHGWRWIDHTGLTEAEEREHIARAVASLASTTGQRPAGWYCRYGPGLNTRRLLVEEGGFTYDSDCYNDELPYWVHVGGRAHLVVPYSMTTNDGKLAASMHTRAWLDFVTDGVDLLRREGSSHPKMASVGLHNRIVGHPSRAAVLERLLDHVAGAEDVWITRRRDIAAHWSVTHPAP